jgi:uncharacterized protein YggE
MRALIAILVVFAPLMRPVSSPAELTRIASDRKTIEIRATEKVTSPAEIATVKIGFQNVAQTKDAVYEENVRTANKIVQALRAAGIPAESIETDSVRLDREDTAQGNQLQPGTRRTRNGAFVLRHQKPRKSST